QGQGEGRHPTGHGAHQIGSETVDLVVQPIVDKDEINHVHAAPAKLKRCVAMAYCQAAVCVNRKPWRMRRPALRCPGWCDGRSGPFWPECLVAAPALR